MQSGKYNFIVDSYIPFMDGLLEPYGSVRVLKPADITREAVRDADALLVRTRTRCNSDLLSGSRVKFVGTATIGLDHIDREWCACAGITAVNAPGCNAPAVAQYVFSALGRLVNRPVSQYTIGIVGVGHVGGIVDAWARSMGMNVMRCDPPRQRSGEPGPWYSLAQIARRADIITFHTPLTREGEDATYHIANERFFNSLERMPIVINASRGPVVDSEALKDAIRRGVMRAVVIDTWEGEPRIDTSLMEQVDIATPHIAGYSREGKIRATRMVLDSLSSALDLPHIEMNVPEPAPVPAAVRFGQVVDSYDIMADDALLRSRPGEFEHLRDGYNLRPEAPGAPED